MINSAIKAIEESLPELKIIINKYIPENRAYIWDGINLVIINLEETTKEKL
jgi:hypothetical protein